MQTRAEIEAALKRMGPAEMADMLALLDELEARKRITLAQNDFLAFIAAVDPTYKFGVHLKRLGGLLMDVEQDIKDRIAVSMAPRFGKSQMISIYYPAWYLGRHPDHKVIVASHTADLAVVMARKVRNLMQTSEYQRIFPEVKIAADAKAAGQWNTNKGGEYYASGVGGALAGRGGHLIIVDDPLSEQDIKNGNTDSLDTTYEWYRSGLRTRLMPNGKICVLHCLVGGTQVRLASGRDKPIRDIKTGDEVVGYADGGFYATKVLGWSNQGLDRVYAVALKSGVIIRGNARHPLLVDFGGTRVWKTIEELKPGMRLVATSPVAGPSITLEASASTTTTRLGGNLQRVLARLAGVGGGVFNALLRVAQPLRTLKGYAWPAGAKQPTRSVKPPAPTTAQKSEVTRISKCNMGSLELSTMICTPHRTGSAQYAGSLQLTPIPPRRGELGGSLSIIATRLAGFALFCATNATSSSKSETRPPDCGRPLNTLIVTLDEILTITPDGQEEVFDIQVEGTESFLANGVVSHNTRWHMRDLIGRLVKDSGMNPDADQYEVFEFPAILHEDNPERAKSLWPEQWSLESLLRTKASMPAWQWNAQYQQNPTAQESAIIKRDWIQWWPHAEPPTCDFIVQSYDTALTTKERSDYSVCQTWGVFTDEQDDTTNVILLNSVKGKWEFPELKEMALQQYKDWEPDSMIVETKASGQPLVDELRRSGILVSEFSPGKGQDKIARLNAVSDMFSAGHVWFPETRWATEVVEELLAFPSSEHDDQVDTCTLALHRVRQGGLLRLRTDHEDNDHFQMARRAAYY
jgi:predicted phage terminase large subunit-like protein